MSFLVQEPVSFINVKLTDDGRRLLSLGRLTFDKAVFSDREVKYDIDRTGSYDIGERNRVLAPKDFSPFLPATNFDNTPATDLTPQVVGSSRQITTASTTTLGFFTGDTNSFAIATGQTIRQASIHYSASTPSGSQTITISGATTFPEGGDLVYIPWEPIQNSGKTYNSSSVIASGNPTVALWYRVLSASSATSTVTLDRATPDFGSTITTSPQKVNAYFYPFDGIDTYYGSAVTVSTTVWNMNIIKTSSVHGTDSTISGYTTYGSIEYNGFKQYLGFSAETETIGVIHYSNQFTGNTYAEQLVEKTIVLDMPTIMWHRTSANTGEGRQFGLRLYDAYGDTFFDNAAQTTYRDLRDGTSSSSLVVGRVYHKLKLMVITDQELLLALTYKSNRNYTLPKPSLNLITSPKFPLSTSDATGLCESGKTYFVSYVAYSNSPSQSGVTFGYPQALPCAYDAHIGGQLDSNSNPQYLSIRFPQEFPFMRKSTNMEPGGSFSGTGWNANKIQILINEVDDTENPQIGSIDTSTWKLISSGVGNGIYTGETTDLTIDPLKLAGYEFVISREDYDSGTTYSLSGAFSAFTSNNDYEASGLTFGNESFFYGQVQTNILATVFKTTMSVFAKNDGFNSTANPSFNGLIDENTYITEVGILNKDNTLVAIGKSTYPIKKNDGRFIALQLEIDF